ncbi:MAG: hypothetical protein Q8M94_12195, partial [Ignavibacteria bacterium]|nr:hypothetical protein [Ignavibacteria bacterium]
MDEIAATIVMRMRDEASPQMKNLGRNTGETRKQFNDFRMTALVMGSALTSVGALLGRLDNPTAKAAAN